MTGIMPDSCQHEWKPVIVNKEQWRHCEKCTEIQPIPPKTQTFEEQEELKQANEYVVYWKPQLRLNHIDFEVDMLRKEENSSLAQCCVAFAHHRQKLHIRHPEDRSEKDKSDFRRGLEVSVVHELLHTKEATWRDHPSIDEVFKKDKWLTQLHEDSLDATAEALVRARRGLERL